MVSVEKGKERTGMELLEKVLDNQNLYEAYKQVYKNKGTSGVDGVTVDELGYYMFKHKEEIKEQITAIYHENKGRYGYRRITMELHNRGYIINHKTVLKLMKQLGLQCFVRIRKYKS